MWFWPTLTILYSFGILSFGAIDYNDFYGIEKNTGDYLFGAMDSTESPCNNFYDYVCGNAIVEEKTKAFRNNLNIFYKKLTDTEYLNRPNLPFPILQASHYIQQCVKSLSNVDENNIIDDVLNGIHNGFMNYRQEYLNKKFKIPFPALQSSDEIDNETILNVFPYERFFRYYLDNDDLRWEFWVLENSRFADTLKKYVKEFVPNNLDLQKLDDDANDILELITKIQFLTDSQYSPKENRLKINVSEYPQFKGNNKLRINGSKEVYTSNAFFDILKLLKENPRTAANLIFIQRIRYWHISDLEIMILDNVKLQDERLNKTKEEVCAHEVSLFLPKLTARVFLDAIFPNSSHALEEQNKFNTLLSNSNEKYNNWKLETGFQHNDTQFIDYHKELNIRLTDDIFTIRKQIFQFYFDVELEMYNANYVTVLYPSVLDKYVLSPAYLMAPFFKMKYPPELLYGSLAGIVGDRYYGYFNEECTKFANNRGDLFYMNGRKALISECFIQLFEKNNYKITIPEYNIDHLCNLRDGLETVYNAFRSEKNEAKQKQLFFISFVRLHCVPKSNRWHRISGKAARIYGPRVKHLKVQAILETFQPFREAFNCPPIPNSVDHCSFDEVLSNTPK